VTVLAEIAELVRRETGIVLPAGRESAILAAVQRAGPGLDPGAFVRAAADPHGDRGLLSRLIDEVTVQETAFVRDRRQLDAIAWHSLRQTAGAAGSPTIRAWSAGCASGEEAYTLALLAAEAFAPAQPPVDVLGTDISGAALAAAAAGRYGERAVRGLEPPLRQHYFGRQADGSYQVGERLRGLVRLRRHNLARDPIPPPGEPGFDLITCRNVLIYLEERTVSQVIESLQRSLRPDGMLMLGAADALQRTAAQPAAPSLRAAATTLTPERLPPQPLRKPLRSDLPLTREQRLAAALDAADQGDRYGALASVASMLADDPLDADAHFIDGLVTLQAGRPAEAAAALRRALYADASFGLAAFTLGRAYDGLGDTLAARRSYEVALRTLDPEDDRHGQMLQQVDLGDIAAACRARLAGTAVQPPSAHGGVRGGPDDTNNVL
jgi:chemotaxis protein methyltransferase CheR